MQQFESRCQGVAQTWQEVKQAMHTRSDGGDH